MKTVSRLFNHLNKKLLITITEKFGSNSPNKADIMHEVTILPNGFYQSKKHLCGRKKIWDLDLLSEGLRELPGNQKTTERSIAAGFGLPLIMVHRMKKAGLAE